MLFFSPAAGIDIHTGLTRIMNQHCQHRSSTKRKSDEHAGPSAESTHSNKTVVRKSSRIKNTPLKDESCSTTKSKENNTHNKSSSGITSNRQQSYEESEEVNPRNQAAMNHKSNHRNRKKRRKNNANRSPSQGRRTQTLPSDQSTSHTSTSTGQDDESDIPGFYYDKEKKCYFKILPNTMTSVGSFVTKETIKKNEAEKQRQLDLKKLESSASSAITSPISSTPKKKTKENLLTVLKGVQCGKFTCENLKTYMIHRSCSNIQPDQEWQNYFPEQMSLRLDDVHKLLISQNRDRMVCVSSLKSCIAQCIQLLTVSETWCPNKKKTVVALKPPDCAVGPVYKKISSICWAPLSSLPGNHTILYTTTCPIGYFPSIVQLTNLDTLQSTPNQTAPIFELNLGFKTVWSCAWNKKKSKFSIGSERKCDVIDFSTRSKWTYNTYYSDPLSQHFSSSNPNILYCGTRAGLILTHDIRTPGSYKAQAQMKQKEGIGCLVLQRDENYLMANDFSGTICTWDLRFRKDVVEYKGLVNSHYQLPFHLDETETLVCATGSDSYTKIWDRRSGALLQSLPPPFPASLESFPHSFYSNRWGNVDGNRALVIVMKNIFKIYC